MSEVSSTSTTACVTEEDTKRLVIEEEEEEENKKEDKEEDKQKLESEGWAFFKADGVEFQLNLKQRLEEMDNNTKHNAEKDDDDGDEDEDDVERYFIGESRLLNTNYRRKFLIIHLNLPK